MSRIRHTSGVLLIFLVAVTALVPTHARGGTDEDRKVATVQKSSPGSWICKRVKQTGSHIKTRVCLRPKEWEAIRQDVRRTMRDQSLGNQVKQGSR